MTTWTITDGSSILSDPNISAAVASTGSAAASATSANSSAMAAAASAAAAAASAAAASGVPMGLLSLLPLATVPPAVLVIQTSGYTSSGIGAGLYVADSVANAALASMYPRFCKADAAGRYFRLIGDYITVEQGGATGTPGVNDQPAIQATVAYAVAVGISEVHFSQSAYESWQPTFPGGTPNAWLGSHIVISGNVALIGPVGGTTISLKNSTGATRSKSDGTGSWWAGWLVYAGTAVTTSVIRDITVLGGTPFTNVLSNAESNIYDKGIVINDAGSLAPNMVKIDHRNMALYNFPGEIWYMGGAYANCTVYVENVTLDTSPQCAWNPGALSRVVAVNLQAGNSYQPCEVIGGKGHTYIGGRFYNGSTLYFTGTSSFTSGFPYWYPSRDTTIPPPYIELIGTKFDKSGNPVIGSWVRGNIVTIDSSISLNGLQNLQDVHLDIEAWCDRTTGSNAVNMGGPATTTTQITGAPAGNYYQLPKNVFVKVRVNRTANAKANNWTMDGIVFNNGLMDAATCQFHVEGSVNNAWKINGTPVASYAVPLTNTAAIMTQGQAFGGTYSNPAANVALDVAWPAMTFFPTGGGTYAVTLNNTYGYSDGQLATFFYGNGGSGTMTFAATGAGYKLPQARALAVVGDKLTLRWSSRAAAWIEQEFVSARQLVWSVSASITPASLASGSQATLGTITATGAAVGDFVSAISASVTSSGVRLWGEVTGANTVTVYARNDSGSAYNPGATTYYARVVKQS